MATQQDLQELLRLQTARKVPMMQAMAQIRALQGVNLRSIQQIADAPTPAVESAIKDPKAARALQNACKAYVKKGGPGKRPAASDGADGGPAKRARQSGAGAGAHGGGDILLGPAQMTPQELESSLDLPVSTDEAAIARAAVQTNRAPLVLAFAVELVRHTMPEQPPSSRLSLAQAVVSANSRSKAVSIGIEKGPSADDEGWGEGQPRIHVMGREIAVLKRGGYEWKGDEVIGEPEGAADVPESTPSAANETEAEAAEPQTQTRIQSREPLRATAPHTWTASQPVSLKSSTFIARAAVITDPSQRQHLIKSLMDTHPNLKTATHNSWAYRIQPSQSSSGNYMREGSFDDGETGGGDLMLRIMRDLNAVDTIVVMTRWYGGVLLGPDRWRLMRNVVTSALAERLRRTGAEVTLSGEAVWGLDLEGMRSKSSVGGYGGGSRAHDAVIGGMQIHRPEAARNYLLKSFLTAPSAAHAPEEESPSKSKAAAKKTLKAQDAEKEENLGLVLGAIRLLYDSWADHVTPAELDRRAWSWYVAVRPEVESGPSGWGAKGTLRLESILKLRRQDS